MFLGLISRAGWRNDPDRKSRTAVPPDRSAEGRLLDRLFLEVCFAGRAEVRLCIFGRRNQPTPVGPPGRGQISGTGARATASNPASAGGREKPDQLNFIRRSWP